MTHTEEFEKLVDELLHLSVNHRDQSIRHAAVRSLSAFAMLTAIPGGPNTLEGREVIQSIENAMLMLEAGGSLARVQ